MIYILIVAAFVIAESKIKKYIERTVEENEKRQIFKGRILIRKNYNEGAFLNFMQKKKELVKTVSCICLGLLLLLFTITLPKKGNKLFKLGLSLALGGAISNVQDRFSRGKVVDYFSFNVKKLKSIIFNLADMAIFLGSIFIFLSSVLSGKRK
jgi:signal peptidase II